jgi:pyruvate/2-oxoglutarate dehydrogenase complex dihydrolipoamide acyltransferase (E2) component
MIEIRVPEDLWDNDDEGTLSVWFYENGARVEQGAVVAQLMLEKAQMDVESPASGTLYVEVPEETPVRKGQVIARVETSR